ncbi:LysR substrate-binding domain-containing protein [Psychromonas sp. 14N.309.X.WAT.B.A12]|uniref:LysR substrate-binding domain-containing protein n=1 Tax=unclassified Psychromonas TaxID=2614957 RepID=UPI0025B1BF8A|nr:LysR substrate-binding domain-containing protein [Psychromonas sp. 14N.309.X.WAT.B.A12]MDN2664588.1 LysR substrate-binding domain-containing protein [Psychromonas sp. 14N.309.X.WAT.B.A12]
MLNETTLPSIKALRTFVAVADNMSFSKAAQALFVSQGAVSKNISSLEKQLGQPLFNRRLNGIELTSAGEQYLPKIIEALEIIQYTTESLVLIDQVEEVLSLNVTPSFASLWLIPHIQQFYDLNKNIRVRIKTGDGIIKKTNGESDIAIRCLSVSAHYENATLLRREKLVLVASPQLLASNPINTIQDVQHFDAIFHITRPRLWEQFKKQNQLTFSSNYSCTGFEHFYMSLEAAKGGLGLALLPDFMVHKSLVSGELINPLNISMDTDYAYYAFIPSYRLSSRKIYEFKQWITANLGQNIDL